MGTPESDVTQSGGGPCALVASQSGGNAGGTTPSKFSKNICRSQHSGHGSGVGIGPAAARTSTRSQPKSSGEVNSPARGAIAREELITAAAKPTTAAARIAKVLACVNEPFISLCHCRVERKSTAPGSAPSTSSRDDPTAELQYCLRAWLSRQPRRMGAANGSGCEAANPSITNKY